jgi:hypothetical protein
MWSVVDIHSKEKENDEPDRILFSKHIMHHPEDSTGRCCALLKTLTRIGSGSLKQATCG